MTTSQKRILHLDVLLTLLVSFTVRISILKNYPRIKLRRTSTSSSLDAPIQRCLATRISTIGNRTVFKWKCTVLNHRYQTDRIISFQGPFSFEDTIFSLKDSNDRIHQLFEGPYIFSQYWPSVITNNLTVKWPPRFDNFFSDKVDDDGNELDFECTLSHFGANPKKNDVALKNAFPDLYV